MTHIIVALILCLIAGAVLYAVYVLLAKVLNPTIHAIAGIILLLVGLLIAFWLFQGGARTLYTYEIDPLRLLLHRSALLV